MTFLVTDEGHVETETEVVDPSSLPLVDSLPLGVGFLHLIQVGCKCSVVIRIPGLIPH